MGDSYAEASHVQKFIVKKHRFSANWHRTRYIPLDDGIFDGLWVENS